MKYADRGDRRFARGSAGPEGHKRRQAELALAVVNLELEAFSCTVSHDLRAPVRAVAGFSGILLKDHAGGLNGEARRLLERISTAGVRMGEMIDGMLALAQVKRIDVTYGLAYARRNRRTL